MPPSLEDLMANAEGPFTAEADNFGLSFAALRSKNFPPIKWLVEGILPEGATILAGKPKLGKSWLALDIAIRVAATDEGYVLGDRLCSSGDVLYLALEDNERRLQSRGRKVIGFMGEWPERLTVATEWPRADEGGIGKIDRWAASVHKPALVIVDVLTAFRAHPGQRESKNIYATDYEAIAGLRSMATRLGVSVLIVHHTRKSEADDPIDAVSGTLGLTGAADTTLILNRVAGNVTLYGRGRDTAELELALSFVTETCRWKITGDAATVRRTDERNVILELLADNKEPMSPNEIADLLNLNSRNVRQLLHKMCKENQVLRVKRGLYAHLDTASYPGHSSNTDNNDDNDNIEDGE